MPPTPALGGVSLRTFRKWLLDAQAFETGFQLGMVTDVERWRIPEGGSYYILDFMIDQPGELRRRGSVESQSTVVNVPGAGSSGLWVAVMCPNFPSNPRVLGIASDGGQGRYLYDVTVDSGAQQIARIDIEPYENPPTYIPGRGGAMTIITSGDPGVLRTPMKAYWDGSQVQVTTLGGFTGNARRSATHLEYLVLANNGDDHMNRIWWSQPGDPETWDEVNNYADIPEPITAMIEFQGSLLVWSRTKLWRVLGDVAPGEPDGNMSLQPVAGVGCVDARSVVKSSTGVYFANEEGVFLTDGASVNNMTLGKGQSITGLWRTLMMHFSSGLGNVVSAGTFQDLFLIVTVIKGVNDVASLLCYLPTNGWVLLSNPCAGTMYATQLGWGNAQYNLYNANLMQISGGIQMGKMANVFDPSDANPIDLGGAVIEPVWESRFLPGGSTGLKRFGYGRLVYQMYAQYGNPVLQVYTNLGLQSEGVFQQVHEGFQMPVTNSSVAGEYRVERKRFRIFRNGTGFKLRIEQHGQSSFTSILGVEYEMAPFFQADLAGEAEGTS